ncbi:hypothetical protein [Rhodospirillum sp. A1_3_36]|uniref:hypothetical protein n=1 Tax=Rhodospirillum sp. A1_3_36 TaxID=3391666 RepID=UPI0039A7749C
MEQADSISLQGVGRDVASSSQFLDSNVNILEAGKREVVIFYSDIGLSFHEKKMIFCACAKELCVTSAGICTNWHDFIELIEGGVLCLSGRFSVIP